MAPSGCRCPAGCRSSSRPRLRASWLARSMPRSLPRCWPRATSGWQARRRLAGGWDQLVLVHTHRLRPRFCRRSLWWVGGRGGLGEGGGPAGGHHTARSPPSPRAADGVSRNAHTGGAKASSSVASSAPGLLIRWGSLTGIHELAHELAPREVKHGPEFVGIYLFLVDLVLGKAEGNRLRAAFKANRVRSSRKAIPAVRSDVPASRADRDKLERKRNRDESLLRVRRLLAAGHITKADLRRLAA